MKNYFTILFLALCPIVATLMSSASVVSTPVSSIAATISMDSDEAFTSLVNELRSSAKPEDIKSVVTALEKISQQGSTNWLVHYHTAYGYGRLAHSWPNTSDVDGWVDKGETALAQARKCQGADASELFTVEAYLNYARIRVNPMLRGYKYSKKGMELLNKSVDANQENPRAFLLVAQHFINVPAFLGGDTEKACEYIAATEKRLDAEAANTDRNPLYPTWGRGESDQIASFYCGANDESKKRDK
ncbi:MAG: hypothetical protein AAGA62_02705 [Bacteroidota bacterium]